MINIKHALIQRRGTGEKHDVCHRDGKKLFSSVHVLLMEVLENNGNFLTWTDLLCFGGSTTTSGKKKRHGETNDEVSNRLRIDIAQQATNRNTFRPSSSTNALDHSGKYCNLSIGRLTRRFCNPWLHCIPGTSLTLWWDLRLYNCKLQSCRNNFRHCRTLTPDETCIALPPLLWIITTTTPVRDVEMVGHIHWFQYENGIRFPAEIGVSEVLPFGIPEDRRRAILTSVDNTSRIEYAKDRPVNRVASRNISRLPFGYEGLHSKEEAERKIVRFVQDKLLTVKGHGQKVYFKSLGLTVVELPCCPKYADLAEEVFHPKTSPRFRHSIHYRHDDSKCSRIIAIAFAKYLEMKRREESDKYWDDQAKSSDWGKYWDEQAESSESHWDDEPADKPIPESSESHWDDEPADKSIPESSDWGKYWDEQASKEPKQPIAASRSPSNPLCRKTKKM
ncbi:hypothetical protein AVEN_52832-1 [Araneus ventricosus]|uniref:Uncharacterized protein n=1 Tax=Araneus ventricosus TaxID=182803 RepID=A0A4Y2A532_ARAVE|nr:hypothetical protein AVEN_52832-1 [Araneus ventricosus]